MLRFGFPTIVLVIVLSALAGAQVSPQGSQNTASAPLLQITQPLPDAKLAQTFVSVQYQLNNPTIPAAGSPNYRVQVDNQDPIVTALTSQSFTGLTPGPHVVTVQLVDANSAPIAGANASVHFTLVNPPPVNQPPHSLANQILPGGSTPLPLLSVIGFGVLLGGLVSALRTR